jgi:hypothetical protein
MSAALSALSTPWVEHATGGVALALTLSGLVHRDDQALRWRTGLAAVLWACHNAALGAETAAAVNLLTVARQGTSVFLSDHPAASRRIACGSFIVLASVSAAFTWEGSPSAAVLMASVLSTYAMFYLHGRHLRGAMFLVSMLWLCHAFVHHSVEQALSIGATAAASAFGAWRLRHTTSS